MKKGKSLLVMAKENIHHLYPEVISVDIDMIRLTNNHFRSKIVLKTKAKIFFANKDAQNYNESLNKSCHAIKKQLERGKVNKVHRLSMDSIFEDEIDKLHDINIGEDN